MMDTVRVVFLRGTSLGNGLDAMPGEVVDLDARLLPAYLAQRRIIVLQESGPATATATSPAPEPEKPARKGKRNV
jgi:hypothetical protein